MIGKPIDKHFVRISKRLGGNDSLYELDLTSVILPISVGSFITMAIVISGVNNNDKITADGTIDLLSGVSYAGIITAPAFTASNNITAGQS